MPRGAAAWINANLTAPRTGEHTLGFAPNIEFRFATAGEMRACAQDLVALLRCYGYECTVREADASTGETGAAA